MVTNRNCRSGRRRLVGQQLIHCQARPLRDLLQLTRRGRVHAVQPVADGDLAHAEFPRKSCLSDSGAFEIVAKSLHMSTQDIGLTYISAIGSPYDGIDHNSGMVKPKERSFLDRALEALRDRYPRDRPTQVRLAKIAGVSQPAAREWGLPDRAPDHTRVLKIARETGVCVEWLYTGRGPKYPPPTQDSDPFLKEYGQLDEEKRRQLINYSEFLRGKPDRPGN